MTTLSTSQLKCGWKRKYESERTALRAAERGDAQTGAKLYIYRCRHCKHWHLTKQPQPAPTLKRNNTICCPACGLHVPQAGTKLRLYAGVRTRLCAVCAHPSMEINDLERFKIAYGNAVGAHDAEFVFDDKRYLTRDARGIIRRFELELKAEAEQQQQQQRTA